MPNLRRRKRHHTSTVYPCRADQIPWITIFFVTCRRHSRAPTISIHDLTGCVMVRNRGLFGLVVACSGKEWSGNYLSWAIGVPWVTAAPVWTASPVIMPAL